MYTHMVLTSAGSLFLSSTLGVCGTARSLLVEVSTDVVEVGPFDTDQDLLQSAGGNAGFSLKGDGLMEEEQQQLVVMGTAVL